jgi:cytochrome c
MKRVLIAVTATAVLALAAGPTLAQEDKAKAAGCLGCHDVDKKKVGPSFKSVAEKDKGKADALVEKLTKGHHGKKPSADDAKAIVDWILGLA